MNTWNSECLEKSFLKPLASILYYFIIGVINLGNGEIWKLEHIGLSKTILPDLYETEVRLT